jgi:hypothetical protein
MSVQNLKLESSNQKQWRLLQKLVGIVEAGLYSKNQQNKSGLD